MSHVSHTCRCCCWWPKSQSTLCETWVMWVTLWLGFLRLMVWHGVTWLMVWHGVTWLMSCGYVSHRVHESCESLCDLDSSDSHDSVSHMTEPWHTCEWVMVLLLMMQVTEYSMWDMRHMSHSVTWILPTHMTHVSHRRGKFTTNLSPNGRIWQVQGGEDS